MIHLVSAVIHNSFSIDMLSSFFKCLISNLTEIFESLIVTDQTSGYLLKYAQSKVKISHSHSHSREALGSFSTSVMTTGMGEVKCSPLSRFSGTTK